ncbi:MAG: IS110 family transposase [Gemmatimonadetes bacterium]|nr:IS110 family transposase [Gemmatimonadota bacterium]
MEVLHGQCAGLDVHKDTVVACARLARGAKVERYLETFGTTTRELVRLVEWLTSHGVTHVAMEATGVYWKPVWHVLAGHFQLVLGNAKEIKNVPGRKTDVNDATWIADLLAHGLIRGSFVPPEPIQELRDLTRSRTQLVRERSQHVQRIQKLLEDANVKLSSFLSDILGLSGRAILEAIIRGETDPTVLAKLAHARVKASRAQLQQALEGRVRDHHRFMLRLHLNQIDTLDASIALVERKVEELLLPFGDLVRRLRTIPAMGEVVVAVLLAEVGPDMSPFPTAAHLVSWTCLSPRQDESAGKRRSTKTRKGQWAKTALVQAAWAAVRCKEPNYLTAQFHRIRSRRGTKKAILAVAASMVTAAYHIIRDGTEYQDLGPDFFQRHDKKNAFRLVQRLRNMGYIVQLQPAA